MIRQRVAHIMPWDGVGGTEQAALRIGNVVKDAGFKTIYFCLGSAPLVRDFFSSAGFDTDTWRPVYPTFNGYRYFLRESIELAKQFRRHGINLVHCGDVPAGAYAALAGRLALTPVICHVRNRHEAIPRPDQTFLRAVTRFAFVSRESWRAFGFRVAESRGEVVYDGVEVSPGDAEPGRVGSGRDVRRELNIPDKATIIGMIARVDQQKDYETLARAAARMKSACVDVRFLVVGSYSIEELQRRHFEQVQAWLAANNVAQHFIFTDFRTDVPRLLNAMDLVVLSTHYEGLPLVLLEAMACGKPVVATAVDGVPEVVTHGHTGLLFAHQDDAALASHLLSLIRDPSRAERLGENGRAHVQTHFNRDQFRQGILNLYETVLGRNKLSAAIAPSLGPVADLALKAGRAALGSSYKR
jgi:glycosyltransferase involved in cell wall biosynthesis